MDIKSTNLFHLLSSFIDAYFKGLRMKRPLFFSGFPGLRFDLQDEDFNISEDAYFGQVAKRMERIHAITINGDDDIIIFYRENTYKRRKIRKSSYLFKQINAATAQVQFKKSKSTIYGNGIYFKVNNCSQVIIYDKAANIEFSNIYLSIANVDFNREPTIRGDLFVVNLTKQTMMLMYDDRGCDLISPNREILKRFYDSLNELILEENIPEIIQSLRIDS